MQRHEETFAYLQKQVQDQFTKTEARKRTVGDKGSRLDIFYNPNWLNKFSLACAVAAICSFSQSARNVLADEYPDPLPIPGTDLYQLIQRDTGTGIASAKGKILISPIYRQVDYVGSNRFIGRFYDETLREEFLYMLDENGKRLCKLNERVQGSEPIHDGVLLIGGAGEYMKYITVQGNEIHCADKFTWGFQFSEGKAGVHTDNHDGAYINKQGRIVWGPSPNTDCFPFQNGFAIVRDCWTEVGGVINKSGRFVIPREFQAISSSDGRHFFARKNGKSFMLSGKNKVIAQLPDNCINAKTPQELTDETLISCEFTVESNAQKKNNKWGFCDINGKLIIPPIFDGIAWTKEGNCRVYIYDFDGIPAEGSIESNGRWIQRPKLLKEISTKELIADWLRKTPRRYSIFSELLNRENLIGMDTVALFSTLGHAQIIEGTCLYDLTPGASCGNIARQLQVSIVNNRVQGWRVIELSDPNKSNWITVNAKLKDLGSGFSPENIIPK